MRLRTCLNMAIPTLFHGGMVTQCKIRFNSVGIVSRGKRAFTLVELLIGMLLFVLVGGVLYLMQSTALNTANRGTLRVALQSETRRKMELMVTDLKCANEILEISESSIRFTRYGQVDEEGATGDDALVTVSYSLEKSGQQWALFREINKDGPKKLITADNIEPEIFFPYREVTRDKEWEGQLFLPFDLKGNDTEERKRITFIRIRLKVRQNREFSTIMTSVTLRPAHSKIGQSGWRFR
ncbi:MAG: prepilin-type N-terminal cleavage/methylation domain-containing protein [Candidatus Riflebacteria bacterium]|nr:prepilin-type N-terminal cleavage/methylation domain-containing protein [Candidatus Riflebacteria bacterium]